MKKKHLDSKSKKRDDQSQDKIRVVSSKAHGVKHRKLLITIVSVLLIAGIGVGSFFIFSRFFVKQSTAPSKETIKQLPSEANKIMAKEGYSAGQKYLDQSLSQVTDSADKASIYTAKSSLALSKINSTSNITKDDKKSLLNDALESEMKADQAKPTDMTALSIANTEEALGNKDEAIKYYQLYIDRVKNPNTRTDRVDSSSYYIQHIKSLEAK